MKTKRQLNAILNKARTEAEAIHAKAWDKAHADADALFRKVWHEAYVIYDKALNDANKEHDDGLAKLAGKKGK